MEPTRYNDVIVKNNGRFVPVYPDLFNDPWWTERPEFKEFIEIANTGVPISYEAPPSAASGEVLGDPRDSGGAAGGAGRRRRPGRGGGRRARQDRRDLRALRAQAEGLSARRPRAHGGPAGAGPSWRPRR